MKFLFNVSLRGSSPLRVYGERYTPKKHAAGFARANGTVCLHAGTSYTSHTQDCIAMTLSVPVIRQIGIMFEHCFVRKVFQMCGYQCVVLM